MRRHRMAGRARQKGASKAPRLRPRRVLPPRRPSSKRPPSPPLPPTMPDGRTGRGLACAGAGCRARGGIAVRPIAESGVRRPPSDRCLCEAVTLRGQGYSGRTRADRYPGQRARPSRQPARRYAQGAASADQHRLWRLWPLLQDWVTIARADGHEVLLQIPLEPADYPKEDPGPHTLLTSLPADGEHEAAAMADVTLYRLCRASLTTWAPSSRRPRMRSRRCSRRSRRAACSMSTTAACKARRCRRSRRDRPRLFGRQRPDRRQRLAGRYRQAAG